ncbi:hypothetical protein KDX20_33020 [Burkholderia cenocepacia]|uniref:hypothetical protein n=1 Tax=Burkholderia cenocepacia TaxID=95486 RepID=UPI00192AEB6C|nr:hypothetical protein [Burkholderia cenocepacia]MBR8159243.1 hypothetical protein [Burkholderia cenocepacia]MCA8082407.1 hypothetical protein [Burkholderia cenocepacia]HEB3529188.1 hypothetical protein [Burkholderia cenocepacia]
MNYPPLELGAVFQTDWTELPIRVIAFDAEVVMYDAWWPHKQAWGMENLSGTFSYYRVRRPLFLSRAHYLRTDEYTELEASIHRPDLPLAYAQFELLNWYDQRPASLSQLAQQVAQARGHQNPSDDASLLKTSAIYLAPFGPKGSQKPPTVCYAQDGYVFNESEVLWNAWQLQAPHLGDRHLTSGIGIYRLGIRRGTPTFYIWGSLSQLRNE